MKKKRKGSATIIVFCLIMALSVLMIGSMAIISRYYAKTYQRKDKIGHQLDVVQIGVINDEYYISNL